MNKAAYIDDFKTKIGTGIVCEVLADSEPLQTDGTKTYRKYRIAYKSVGVNANGATITFGAAHYFAVFNEGAAGEIALPVENAFANPAEQAPTGNTLESIAKIFQSQTLRSRVLGAMLVAAFQVKWEAVETAQHAARVALSGEVITEPNKYTDAFMFTLATESTIQSAGVAATDSAIQNLVNAWWTYIAETQGLTA